MSKLSVLRNRWKQNIIEITLKETRKHPQNCPISTTVSYVTRLSVSDSIVQYRHSCLRKFKVDHLQQEIYVS